jgi:hypothetical protein
MFTPGTSGQTALNSIEAKRDALVGDGWLAVAGGGVEDRALSGVADADADASTSIVAIALTEVRFARRGARRG